MTTSFRFTICAAALSLFGFTAQASADVDDHYEDRDGFRLYGGLGLGFGGEAEIDYRGPLGLIDVGGSSDLVTSVGGQVGFDIPVIRYLSLGGEARFLSFNSEALDDNDVDRSKLIDIAFKPRLTFPLRRSPVEFYFTVPVGITFPILADDFGDGDAIDGEVGWNLGVGAGVNFWLTRRIALNLEPSYLMHWFDLDLPTGSGDLALKQFTLFANVVFAL